jgi:hypothetical protein
MMAAAAGIVPPSPAPLTPIGLSGEGLSMWTMSTLGTSGGQEVFLQRRRLRLCFSVVKHILEECIADAMRNSASDLAIDDERIDCPAAIVADGIAENVDTPEFRIDFHFRDMGSVGISRMRRKEIVDFCKAGLRRLAAEAGVPERKMKEILQPDPAWCPRDLMHHAGHVAHAHGARNDLEIGFVGL